MNRTSSIVSVFVLTLVGCGLFHVAQNVRDYEGQLKTIRQKLTAEQETIHTLQAEWVYLNQPGRLEKLAKKHTDLKPIDAKNLVALSVVPVLETAEEQNPEAEQQDIAQEPQGYESYISKSEKKTMSSQEDAVTLPVHNVSLRDIWGR